MPSSALPCCAVLCCVSRPRVASPLMDFAADAPLNNVPPLSPAPAPRPRRVVPVIVVALVSVRAKSRRSSSTDSDGDGTLRIERRGSEQVCVRLCVFVTVNLCACAAMPFFALFTENGEMVRGVLPPPIPVLFSFSIRSVVC